MIKYNIKLKKLSMNFVIAYTNRSSHNYSTYTRKQTKAQEKNTFKNKRTNMLTRNTGRAKENAIDTPRKQNTIGDILNRTRDSGMHELAVATGPVELTTGYFTEVTDVLYLSISVLSSPSALAIVTLPTLHLNFSISTY